MMLLTSYQGGDGRTERFRDTMAASSFSSMCSQFIGLPFGVSFSSGGLLHLNVNLRRAEVMPVLSTVSWGSKMMSGTS